MSQEVKEWLTLAIALCAYVWGVLLLQNKLTAALLLL